MPASKIVTDSPPPSPRDGQSTREEWLTLAIETLIRDGIDRVKVQVMARDLGVSRSSFYWFFKSPQDLHRQMLDYWLAKNTGPIIQWALRPAATITEAILGVFGCWLNESLFDPRLDVAVRLWGRRAPSVWAVVVDADRQRLDALQRMFIRHGYDAQDALVRSRVLYFTQIGQYTLDINEPLEERLTRAGRFAEIYTGCAVDPQDYARFCATARAVQITAKVRPARTRDVVSDPAVT